jgi:hypothetical protein
MLEGGTVRSVDLIKRCQALLLYAGLYVSATENDFDFNFDFDFDFDLRLEGKIRTREDG